MSYIILAYKADPVNNRSGPVSLTLATRAFVLKVDQSTLHVEYVSHGVEAVIAVRRSYFFFNRRETLIAYPRAKVTGNFGRKPDRCIFWMIAAGYRLRRRSWGIGLETCTVLKKPGHVDWKDLLPSAKACSKDVPAVP
jgi:hypothetical protein